MLNALLIDIWWNSQHPNVANRFLKYGIYIPIILSITWIVFEGCPLTKGQTNLSSNSFTQDV
jgi:hypothetical protein